MFAYPKQAEVNRVVAKTKIFAHCKASKRLKELFAAQVGEILWKYKLSPETINLPARDGINELQVFEITVKTESLADEILLAIDKAIPFPLFFRIVHAEHTRFAAAFKRPSDTDTSKWVVETLFHAESQFKNTAPAPLPVALDLASLYEQIVRHHMPLPARLGENLREHVTRCELVVDKEVESMLLEASIAKEKQFNRRVEMNAALRLLTRELKALRQP